MDTSETGYSYIDSQGCPAEFLRCSTLNNLPAEATGIYRYPSERSARRSYRILAAKFVALPTGIPGNAVSSESIFDALSVLALSLVAESPHDPADWGFDGLSIPRCSEYKEGKPPPHVFRRNPCQLGEERASFSHSLS